MAITWKKVPYIDDVVTLTNPKAMSQAVALTAAETGGGIVVADDADIDFGTGNFTLVWKGSLPDWTPGANQYLISKYEDSSNEVFLRIDAGGAICIAARKTSWIFLSTTTTIVPAVDGTVAEIVVVVNREGGSNGSAIFYVNGTLLETEVIPAAATVNISNSGELHLLGRNGVRNAGNVHRAITYNRALTAAEVLSLYTSGIAAADQWGSQTAIYTSNFSAGVDSWARGTADVVVTGNVDGINGSNDWLKIERITSIGRGDVSRGTGVAVANKKHRITVSIYNDAGSAVTHFVIGQGSNLYLSSVVAVPAGTEVSCTFEPGVHPTSPAIYLFPANSNGTVNNSVAVGTIYYIKTVVSYSIGATLALEPEGITPNKWIDSSTNQLDAAYPASGYSFTRSFVKEMNLVDPDIAHGMTTLAATNTFGLLKPISGTLGGLDIYGLTDLTQDGALRLTGIIGAADPTDTHAAIHMRSGKANGTGWQALAAAETVFRLSNYTTDIATVLGSGYIGIGKTVPTRYVDIEGGAADVTTLYVKSGAGITGNTPIFSVDNRTQEIFRVMPTGDFLSNGYFGMYGSASGNGCVFMVYNNAGGAFIPFQVTGNAAQAVDLFKVQTHNGATFTPRLLVNKDGLVGMCNVDVPVAPLHIYGPNYAPGANISITQYIVSNNALAAGMGAGIGLGGVFSTSSPYYTLFAEIDGVKANATDGDYDGTLIFKVRANGGNAIEMMRIDAAGKVGIGRIPSAKLDVYDATFDRASVYLSATYGTAAEHYTAIRFNNLTGAWGNSEIRGYANGLTTQASKISFWTTDTGTTLTEKVVINYGGNVGIGVASPFAKLDLYKACLNATTYGMQIDTHIAITEDCTGAGRVYPIGLMIDHTNQYVATTKTNAGYHMALNAAGHVNNVNFRGTLTYQYGGYFTAGAYLSGAGAVISNAYAIKADLYFHADMTLTNVYGMNIGAMAGATGTNIFGYYLGSMSGTQTTKYGLCIEAMSGASTTNYGIYLGAVTGATTNYAIHSLGGKVSLAGLAGIWGGAVYDFVGVAIGGTATMTASSGYAIGLYINAGYTAAANANVISPLFVAPGTVAKGAYTGLFYRGITISTPTLSGAGTIADYSGINILADSNAATVKYGLYIGSVTGGGTNYAISTGAGIVAFGGYVTTVGGVHVGGTSDPGADNLLVDGMATSASSKTLASTGGMARYTVEATVVLTGKFTVIVLNVPANSFIFGCQLRVDTAVTGATTWGALYSGGNASAICTGQALTKDTKFNSLSGGFTTAATNITIIKDGADFSGGVMRAIVYYETFVAMANA